MERTGARKHAESLLIHNSSLFLEPIESTALSLMVLKMGRILEINLCGEVSLFERPLYVVSYVWETTHLVFLPRFLFVFGKFQICSCKSLHSAAIYFFLVRVFTCVCATCFHALW